jgi:hypothetical protein
MSVSEAFRDVVDESVESTALASRTNGFHLPRCRICRNDQVRTKVNDLLATGASYAMVLRALGEDNAELDKRDRVTIDSIRNHCGRHFPVQNVAKATYREILERRAKANGIDFIEGVATAITPLAFYETVMVKGYETLVDSDTKVDVNTGMVAAGRLQSLMDSRDYDHELLVMKVQLAQICDAVKSTVPQEMWGRSSRSSRSWSSIRRRSTSAPTPSMTQKTIPTTRPSSSTMTTTSSDPAAPAGAERDPSPRAMGTAADVDGTFAVWNIITTFSDNDISAHSGWHNADGRSLVPVTPAEPMSRD